MSYYGQVQQFMNSRATLSNATMVSAWAPPPPPASANVPRIPLSDINPLHALLKQARTSLNGVEFTGANGGSLTPVAGEVNENIVWPTQ